MDAEQRDAAERCLAAAHDGSMSFPQIIGALTAAGFEGYAVDFRRNAATCHLASGEVADLPLPGASGPIAPAFDAAGVEACIREAQANAPGYTYEKFCRKVRDHGCAGYVVSFTGRRVLYIGRTAETHLELFPS